MTAHPAALTVTDFAAIEARGAVVHFGHASLRRSGDRYVMEGRTGRHTLGRMATDLDRLNGHWTKFADFNRADLKEVR